MEPWYMNYSFIWMSHGTYDGVMAYEWLIHMNESGVQRHLPSLLESCHFSWWVLYHYTGFGRLVWGTITCYHHFFAALLTVTSWVISHMNESWCISKSHATSESECEICQNYMFSGESNTPPFYSRLRQIWKTERITVAQPTGISDSRRTHMCVLIWHARALLYYRRAAQQMRTLLLFAHLCDECRRQVHGWWGEDQVVNTIMHTSQNIKISTVKCIAAWNLGSQQCMCMFLK